MTTVRRPWPWFLVLVSTSCATTARPPEASVRHEASARCASAAFGIETTNASRLLRRRHHLPKDARGALVIEVLPESPAARAGLAVGDVVERVGETTVHGYCEFLDAMAGLACGRSVPVAILRGEARLTKEVRAVDAFRFFEAACQKGQATACYRLGWLTASGVGTPKDPERAEALYQEACDKGSGAACTGLGHLLEGKRGLEKKHRALLERACELHDATGCVGLAYLHVTGSGGASHDEREATRLYTAGCDGGDPIGCFNTGLNYELGRGVKVDLRDAIAAYEEGCDGGSTKACTNLGLCYDNGLGVVRSFEKAAELYGRGCRASACEGSNPLGCVNLGRLYRDGRGVTADAKRAAELFSEVCERTPVEGDADSAPNIARACSLLGAAYASGSGVGEDPARALALSRKGCDAGDTFGCFNVGVFLATGVGAPKDSHAAAMAFRRACDGDDAESCYELGLLTAKGQGVERNDAAAAKLFEKACKGGFEKACAKGKKGRAK